MNVKNIKKFLKFLGKLYSDKNLYFHYILQIVEFICQLICVIIILIGVLKSIKFIKTFYKFRINKHYNKNIESIKNNSMITIRINVAEAVNLGLTFILAADIVRTIRIPSYYQLGKVVILVGLREFVTHFVDKELVLLKSGKLI